MKEKKYKQKKEKIIQQNQNSKQTTIPLTKTNTPTPYTTIKQFLTLLLTFLTSLTTPGRIYPDKTFPIKISQTNAGDRSQYLFKLKTSQKILPSCKIEINFPEEEFIQGLGLDYNFEQFLIIFEKNPQNFEILEKKSILQNQKISGKKIEVWPGYVDNGVEFGIGIEGIQNPFKTGGQGSFGVFLVCEDSGSGQEVVVDGCGDFGIVAVTQPKVELLDAHIMVEEGSQDIAGTEQNYIIYLQPRTDLSKNIVFRATFPTQFNFSYLSQRLTDFPQDNPCTVIPEPLLQNNQNLLQKQNYVPQGNFTCGFNSDLPNVIEWVGNDQKIPKNSKIFLKLEKVENPKFELKTEFLKLEIVLKNTNLAYEYKDAVDGLIIQPGKIENFKLQPVFDVPLEALNFYDFLIQFTPTNPFNQIRIVTRFREIQQCIVQNSIIPDTVDNSINCVINQNLLEISDIVEYQRTGRANSDRVEIKVRARTSLDAGVQLPFEIYTYLGNGFEQKVDQDLTSFDTQMTITTSPPDQPGTVITETQTAPDAQNTMKFDIHPLGNYTIANNEQVTVKIAFDPLFQFGVTQLTPIKCFYHQLHQ